MSTLNKKIENALNYANSQTISGGYGHSYHRNISKYWENKETIEWDDLCNFSNTKFYRGKAIKYSLCMLVYFLENNLYQSKHKDKLMHDLPYLKQSISNFKTIYALIFQGDYEELHFINKRTEKGGNVVVPMFLFNCNIFFESLYIKYLEENNVASHYISSTINYDFMRSVEGIEVNSLNDIDSALFWHQASFFKTFYSQDENNKNYSLKNLCKFYRWLLNKFNNHAFFVNSTNLTYELIFSNALSLHIINDAYFTPYNSTEDLGDKPRIVFVVKNFQNKSTRLVKYSHFALYTDKLENSFYRKMVIKYFQNASTPTMLSCGADKVNIIDTLHFIEQIKSNENYPNPALTSFNTKEALLIRNYIIENKPKLQLGTLNNKIASTRKFLLWCKNCGYLNFDSTFFDYLSQFEEPNLYRGNAIPDADLKKISETFIELCNKDSKYRPYYAIFLILIETEFRVSQVCNLSVSSLQPTLKKDQFLIYSATKTSNGQKMSQPICTSTKKILESIIEDTEQLRNEVLQESYKDYIFLYRSTIGKAVRGINSAKFVEVFKNVCEIAGTQLYNSRNLRDTHMTKAFEYILRNGKSDLEMNLLSRHSRIDTTKSYYIEMELTKMLESTYKVTLGNRDINQQSQILDSLPQKFDGNDTLVENGCGHCIAKSCTMTGSLPCLICKDFVTTVDHKHYFIKMISNCDELLKKTTIRHEIEDINLIKTLYVNWLKNIYIKEEEAYANTTDN